MSLTVFMAILFAAFLHASWNALIKLGTAKLTAMLILTVVQGMLGLGFALTREFPQGQVWLWLAASGVLHAVYKMLLAFAYEHGDLSRVYPIARGAAPLIVLMVGAFVLKDQIAILEIIGIVVLGLGILLMARGVLSSGESRRLLPFALGSALATAGYTLVDGMGARLSGDPLAFVAWMFFFDATLFLTAGFAIGGRDILKVSARVWIMGSIAAVLSYGAYAIAVWGMTVAPIALVAALRETSILFAVLIGWVAFGDRMDRGKAAATAMIVLGVVLTRI